MDMNNSVMIAREGDINGINCKKKIQLETADEVLFVYSFLYVPCFRGRDCEDVAAWNI